MSGAQYTHDAKKHNENKAYAAALDAVIKWIGKSVLDITEDDLRKYGVLWSKMPQALRWLAAKLAEYYGVKAWELDHNPELAQKRCGISDKHLRFILQNLWISQAMSYFRKIQVDEGEGNSFNVPTEVITPKIDKRIVDQALQEFKKVDELAAKQQPDGQ